MGAIYCLWRIRKIPQYVLSPLMYNMNKINTWGRENISKLSTYACLGGEIAERRHVSKEFFRRLSLANKDIMHRFKISLPNRVI